MQVKVFEAVDMPTGLKMVKEDLGPDALILSTRTIRNGKLGMLGKPTLEITAAIDSPWPEETKTTRPAFAPPAAASVRDTALTQETLTYQDIWARAAEEETSSDNGYNRPVEQESLSEDADSLSREIRELKQIIDSLSRRMVQQDAPPLTHAGPLRPVAGQTNSDPDPVVQFLLARGLNPQVAGLVARFTGGDTAGIRRAAELLINAVRAQFGVELSLHEADVLLRQRRPKLYTAADEVNLRPLVTQVLDTTAAEVVTYVERRWGNARQFAHLLFTGGGAESLRDTLLRQYPHGIVLPSPVAANAIGLARYAVRAFGE